MPPVHPCPSRDPSAYVSHCSLFFAFFLFFFPLCFVPFCSCSLLPFSVFLFLFVFFSSHFFASLLSLVGGGLCLFVSVLHPPRAACEPANLRTPSCVFFFLDFCFLLRSIKFSSFLPFRFGRRFVSSCLTFVVLSEVYIGIRYVSIIRAKRVSNSHLGYTAI